jgi:hypothetical protein
MDLRFHDGYLCFFTIYMCCAPLLEYCLLCADVFLFTHVRKALEHEGTGEQ